jgi:type IV pilus assembly protein PilV
MEPVVSLDNRSGFTLIEFCVAVLIMMVGLMGLLQAVNIATVHNLGSLLRNEAVSVADEQMVLAKTSVYNSDLFTHLGDGTADDLLKIPKRVDRKTRGGFSNYSVNWRVSPASTISKEIEVRVTWRYKGNRFNHRISTLILNPTP